MLKFLYCSLRIPKGCLVLPDMLSLGLLFIASRVSFETSFDSKQPKLEPKLVPALSETKRLLRLFCFYIKTARFGD